tara:strand:+ start:73 stop:975 length:903 start_codon:yes stop_codon:yes gene_type:complete
MSNDNNTRSHIYKVFNKNNKLLSKNDIQKFLKMGGISESIVNMKIWQQAFTNDSYSKNVLKSKYTRYIDETEIEIIKSKKAPDGFVHVQKKSNETLEWLGDAYIQSIVSMILMKRFGKQNEGFLTKMRSKLVKTETLYKLSKSLEMNEFLLISEHSEILSNGRNNAKLLEDLFESFIGAMIIDFTNKVDDAYAYKLCKIFISNCIDKYIDMTEIIKNDDNYKDQLMRFFHKRFDGNLPKYKLINTQTINKKNGAVYKNFTIIVNDPDGNELGRGKARSKKEAEQQSAKQALKKFGITQKI